MNKLFRLQKEVIPPLVVKMRSVFVRSARSLESLKTGDIPQAAYENGKFLVMLEKNDVILVETEPARQIAWKDYSALREYFPSSVKVILDVVTDDRDTCLFAVDIPSNEDAIEELGRKLGGSFVNTRKALFLVKENEACMVSRARGLMHFCRTTNFCKSCGNSLETRPSGTQKICTGCKKQHYPTISPVGIVLIENKSHEKVLLVRGARHPLGMFSCVAGFVEAGESLEENIRREVAEEVGLDIERIEFVASQHWAMPESQLMLGCLATASSEDFDIDPVELEGGQWVDAAVLRGAVDRAKGMTNVPRQDTAAAQTLWVPPPAAVAHSLMEIWLKRHHSYVSPVTSRI